MRRATEFDRISDADCAYEIPGLSRFRVNVFEDRKGVGTVIRTIPVEILTAEQLNLPKPCLDLCYLTKGLVLVTGPTGLGKVDHARGDGRLHQQEPLRPHHHD